MDDEEKTILGCLTYGVALIWVAGSVIIRGWLLSLFWLWYVVPLGILPIGTAHAIGFSTAAQLFHRQHNYVEKKDDSTATVKLAKAVATEMLTFILLYCMGSYAHSWM